MAAWWPSMYPRGSQWKAWSAGDLTLGRAPMYLWSLGGAPGRLLSLIPCLPHDTVSPQLLVLMRWAFCCILLGHSRGYTSDQNCKKPGYTIGNYIKAGKMEESNDRVINQLIVYPVLSKVEGGGCCQLQMGLTELKPGSVWNTMPQHTHNRRMEAYFYVHY